VEYIHDAALVDVFWPADEFAFIDLVRSRKLKLFLEEQLKIFQDLVPQGAEYEAGGVLFEKRDLLVSVNLSEQLLRLPGRKWESNSFHHQDLTKFAVLFTQVTTGTTKCSARSQDSLELEDFTGDFDEWMRDVVWYGHRSGSYSRSLVDFSQDNESLFQTTNINLVGHFS
jgi:hypothetical protein